MKKTFVAIAALAATGAFAQVTITGSLVMGYNAYSKGGATTTDASGFGVDTSQLNFNTTEDLGGGAKLEAQLRAGGLDRSNGSGSAVVGKDAFLKLSNATGYVTLAFAKENTLSNSLAAVGALFYGMDTLDGVPGADSLFYKRSNRDSIMFGTKVGAFSASIGQMEGAANGLGVGAAGSSTQRLIPVTVGYNAGKLAAEMVYTSFDNRIEPAAANSDANVKDQIRLDGSYDFGMAKLGLGWQQTNNVTNSAGGAMKDTQILVGVVVPMGSLQFGANLGNRQVNDSVTAANNGSRTGYGLSLKYSMSKRTSVISQYSRWDTGSVAIGAGTPTGLSNASNQFSLLLSHSF